MSAGGNYYYTLTITNGNVAIMGYIAFFDYQTWQSDTHCDTDCYLAIDSGTGLLGIFNSLTDNIIHSFYVRGKACIRIHVLTI